MDGRVWRGGCIERQHVSLCEERTGSHSLSIIIKPVDVERIVSYIEPCRFQLSSNLLLNETQECTKRDGWGKEREMERGSKRHDSWNGLHNNRGEGGCM